MEVKIMEENKKDDRKLCLAVKDLYKYKNPGFWRIRSVLRKHFTKISFFRAFFIYYIFLSWLPHFYINATIEKIIKFIRNETKDGAYLPEFGSKIISVSNTYLANYNRTVQRFRDDSSNPIGDKDLYIRQQLKKQEIIGYPSINKLYKDFAKAASHSEFMPTFELLSSGFLKFRLLDYSIFKNPILHPVKSVFRPITSLVGLPFYISAKLVESIPNKIVKYGHLSLLSYFMPSVLSNTVNSVSTSGFSHAINSFLCDVIQDFLNESKKKPHEKELDDTPNIVTEALSNDIKKFSEHLYTILQREPFKTQEELEYLKNNGPSSKSWTESIFKIITPKHYLEKKAIQPIFAQAFQGLISDGFNFIFGKQQNSEEYLYTIINSLNSVFEYVPDPLTEEGKALIEDQIYINRRKTHLVNELLEKSIKDVTISETNKFASNFTRNYFTSLFLSSPQKEAITIGYRKIHKKAEDHISILSADSKDVTSILSFKSPTDAQSALAKKEIEKASIDIDRFEKAIENILPAENGPELIQMRRHLGKLLNHIGKIKRTIGNIQIIHDKIDGFKRIEIELKLLTKDLESRDLHNTASQMQKVKGHLDTLNQINIHNQFNSIIHQFNDLSNQLLKILRHNENAILLTKLISNNYFSSSLISDLAKAQKEYIYSFSSTKKENKLKTVKEKIEQLIKELEKNQYLDVSEIKDGIRRILNSHENSEIDKTQNYLLNLIKKKYQSQKSLAHDETTILPQFYNSCKIVILKQLTEFPTYFEEINNLQINEVENLQSSIKNIEENIKNIENQRLGINKATPIKHLSNLALFGLAYTGNLSILAASLLALIPNSLSIARKLGNNTALPLAKSTVDSAYNVATNQAFYEGLIHSLMKSFIEYIEDLKK